MMARGPRLMAEGEGEEKVPGSWRCDEGHGWLACLKLIG